MLSELTGRDRRTIKQRLKDLTPVGQGSNGGDLYDIRAAIRAIFEWSPDDENQEINYSAADFQPAVEKAKLDFIKRQAMELEIAEKKRELIPAGEIKSALHDVFASIRAKLRALPTRAAQQIIGPPQKQTEHILSALVDETLTDLSEGNFNV